MRFPSFEQPEKNPFSIDAEPADEPLSVPDKKEAEKKKEPKEEQKKSDEDEKNQKDKKKDKEAKEKDTKKPKKDRESDEEALEIKKNKRKRLIERSLQYKKLYEETPIPRNPWVVARLMVADHLLALHTRIEQPATEVTSAEERELLASFDYMGIIADKLEDPELETSPEIQETCEIIMHLAEEALQENEPDVVENLVVTNATSARQPLTETLPEKNEVTLLQPATSLDISPAGTALITVLLHARQPVPTSGVPPLKVSEDEKPMPLQYIGGGGASPIVRPQEHVSISSAPRTAQSRDVLVPPSPRLEVPTKVERRTPENRTFSSAPIRTSEALAGLAVATTLLNNSEAKSSSPVVEQQAPPSTVHYESHASSGPPATHHASSPRHFEAPSYIQPLTTPHEPKPHTPVPYTETHMPAHSVPEYTPQNAANLSSREIEHLPLNSLLKAAETVSIGHGQRLRSAFEKGMIDKEGLVKVLKSHTKHHDFLHEYKQQVVRRRNTIQSSPEFLSRPPVSNTGTGKNIGPSDHISHQSSEAPIVAPSSNPLPSWPEFPNPVKNTPDTDPLNLHEPPRTRSAWFGIAALGLLILSIALLVGMYLIFR